MKVFCLCWMGPDWSTHEIKEWGISIFFQIKKVPDPHQNATNPQHCVKGILFLFNKVLSQFKTILIVQYILLLKRVPSENWCYIAGRR